jgi:formate-dependent nitrite reductase membrane component NrfD
MIYDGFALKQSRGIRFWNTYLSPVLAIGYATLGGITLTLVVQSITLTAHQGSVEALEIALLVVNLVLVGPYVVTARKRGAAAQVGGGHAHTGTAPGLVPARCRLPAGHARVRRDRHRRRQRAVPGDRRLQ